MASPVDIPPGHLEIVQDILQKYLPPGINVYVFGSRADWTTKDSSDLDLALEGGSELEYGVVGALEYAFEESDLPYAVDVVDLNLVGDSFRRIVDAQKIPLPTLGYGSSVRWPRLRFGDCAKLVRDTVSPEDLEDVPYIGLEHIGKNTLTLVDCGVAKDVSSTKTRFRRGDILFGKLRPYFRKVIRAGFDGICSTDIWVVRPIKGMNVDFLFYVMASSEFVNSAARGSEGTRMPRAKWGWVSQYETPIPPLNEQHVIARVLRTLDEKIELNWQMNKTLEGMARTLFKSWFVDFEPVRAKMDGRWRRGESLPGLPAHLYDLFPDRLVDSDLGKIPKGWTTEALNHWASVNPESWSHTNVPKEVEYIDLANTKWGVVESTQHFLWSNAPSRAKRVLRSGDTIVGTVRPANGSYSLIATDGLTGSTGFAVLRPKNPRYREFVYLAVTAVENIERLAHRADGAAYPAVQPDVVAETKVVMPRSDHDILDHFSKTVAPLFNKAEFIKAESRSLAILRDELLPKLISGELGTFQIARERRTIQ